MLFSINRTSAFDDKPCDESFLAKHEKWHTRTCTEDEFNERYSNREGVWRSKGKNHTTLNDGRWVTRQEEDVELWSINIDTLEQLIELVNKYGDVILKQEGYSTKTPEIEIYDDYRE